MKWYLLLLSNQTIQMNCNKKITIQMNAIK